MSKSNTKNNLRITDDNFRYIIDREHGVTVAILTLDPDCLAEEVKNIRNKTEYRWYNNSFFEQVDLSMPEVIKAKTTLLPGEEFDEELGKRIAKKKVLAKYYAIRQKVLFEYVSTIKDYCDRLDKTLAHSAMMEASMRKYFKKDAGI